MRTSCEPDPCFPCKGKPIQLSTVWLFLHTNVWHLVSLANPIVRKPNLSFAHSASTPAPGQETLRDACFPIQEKTSSVAPSVTISALASFTSKHTCQPNQEKTFHWYILRVLLHKSWIPQDTPANTLRRETICLHTLQLLLHSSWFPCEAYAIVMPEKKHSSCTLRA